MSDDDRTDDRTDSDSTRVPEGSRRLTRRHDDRLIAGVAAGFAAYFDIDPVIARLVFVGLGLYGGLGIVIYLVCWAVMPVEGGDGADRSQRGGTSGTRVVGIVVLVIAALVAFNVLAGTVWRGGGPGWPWPGAGPWGPGPFAPLRPGILFAILLVAAGIALYQFGRPNGSRRSDGDGAWSATPPPGPSDADPPAAASRAENAPASAAAQPAGPHEPPAAATAASPPAAPGHAEATQAAPTQPGSGTPAAVPAPEPRPRSPLGRLTLAIALLATGGLALLGQTTIVDPTLADLMAVGLVVVGLGLLVGAWWGRARWLIAVGFALLPFVLLALLLPLPRWHEGRVFQAGAAGEQIYRPTTAEDLRDHYLLATGRILLDLRELELDPGSQEAVSVDVSAGQIEVLLPPGVDVRIDARALVGSVQLPDWEAAGILVSERRTDGVNGAARLELDVSVRAGEIVVRRAPETSRPPDAEPPATGTEAERVPRGPDRLVRSRGPDRTGRPRGPLPRGRAVLAHAPAQCAETGGTQSAGGTAVRALRAMTGGSR